MRHLVIYVPFVSCLVWSACAGDFEPDAPGRQTSALTDDECVLGAVDGKVQICHETSADSNAFVLISVATSACERAHADHDGDYLAENGRCEGGPVCEVFCRAGFDALCPDGHYTACVNGVADCCHGGGGGGGGGDGGG